MKTLSTTIALLLLSGCIYLTSPGAPPVETIKPNGVSEYKFDWSGLWFYLAQFLAAGRWALVEWKHRKLVLAGKKDLNRDGKED